MSTAISTSPAWGIGLATVTADGPGARHLVPGRLAGPGRGRRAEPRRSLPAGADRPEPCRACRTVEVRTEIGSLADPIKDAADAYLRLHLLSHRLVRPNELNLDGIFGMLAERGLDLGRAVPAGAGRRAAGHRARRRPAPGGLRGRQVPPDDRLRGARPGCGSPTPTGSASAPTWPPAPRSCTRASATSTPARWAPRWSRAGSSQGVVVGDGSDIGGGASIMGTLSGGGKDKVRIGERSLLGANAGVGISLGDDCVVEAGCYITAASKITAAGRPGRQGPRAVRGERAAVLAQLGDRRAGGPAAQGHRASSSTPPCTPTTEPRLIHAISRMSVSLHGRDAPVSWKSRPPTSGGR